MSDLDNKVRLRVGLTKQSFTIVGNRAFFERYPCLSLPRVTLQNERVHVYFDKSKGPFMWGVYSREDPEWMRKTWETKNISGVGRNFPKFGLDFTEALRHDSEGLSAFMGVLKAPKKYVKVRSRQSASETDAPIPRATEHNSIGDAVKFLNQRKLDLDNELIFSIKEDGTLRALAEYS